MQVVSISLLYALAYGVDLWRLSASYDVAALRFTTATFFAMTFPQVILVCGILLVGYMTVLQKPSIWVSSVYIVAGGYVALLPSLLMSSYVNHSEMAFITSIMPYHFFGFVSSTTNSLFSITSSAIFSIGIFALFASLYGLYKKKKA